MSQQQNLASKERTLFAQLVKNYEAKQYKKGLKAAEQILRKNPSHGDTQAMKALIINAQGNSDEAFALCKLALKNTMMKSHICWHVYGLLWRYVKNFDEAIKSYKFALNLERDSQQIQRDLALLQIQMRDYEGYIQTRRIILQGRMGLRQNWTALAVAQHLAGDLVDAERTLSGFEGTLKGPPPKSDIEHSEAVLYKNTIIAEMGDIERALDHLESISKTNLDRTAVMEMRADYLLRLDRKEEAEQAFRALLDRNAEYRQYYTGLQKALGLENSDRKALRSLFDEFARRNPRGDAAKRIPLDFLEGEDFRAVADQYLKQMLHKGVPSTFANVKSLYSDAKKRQTIQDLAESYLSESQTPLANGSAEKQVDEEKSISEKQSSFHASVLYFLAQHYNYHLSRDLSKAMKFIDQAIAHQPEEVNYQMTKARIWKHHGNLQRASEAMEKARTLDERDRYINTKAAKYQLRNNDHDAAIANMGKFTRNEAVGGPLGDLHDMQCLWYITEDGEAYLRQGNLGLALKRFTSVYNIFDLWHEDQFDFHTFSLRKGLIRAYVDMFRWEDRLREHPSFTRAAVSAARIYIRVFDSPSLAEESNQINGSLDGLNSGERKKAQKKARKAQERQEQEAAEKKDAKKTAGVGVDGEPKKEDKDPKGLKLLAAADPLADSMKFISPLLEFSPKNVEAQQIGFEVFVRRSKCYCTHEGGLNTDETEKYTLALRCLIAAHSIDASSPTTHEQCLRFRQILNTLPEPLQPELKDTLDAEFSIIVPKDADLMRLNSDFLVKNGNSAKHVQASLRARQVLDPKSAEENQKDLMRILALDNVSLEDAICGLDQLKDWKAQQRFQDDYVVAAQQRWPESSIFGKW